jgi:hypothetical protein
MDIAIDFGINNYLYKNDSLCLLKLILNNKINDIPNGILWIGTKEKSSWINGSITIDIGPNKFSFVVTEYQTHWMGSQEYSHLIQLNLHHVLYKLSQDVQCTTWNNMDLKAIAMTLFNKINFMDYQWILGPINTRLLIQYNQDSWSFLINAINENQGILYYKNKIIVGQNLTPGQLVTINNGSETVGQDTSINLMKYQGIHYNQSNNKIFTKPINRGIHQQNYHDQYYYDGIINKIFTRNGSIAIGDEVNKQTVIGQQYIIQFHGNNQWHGPINDLINGNDKIKIDGVFHYNQGHQEDTYLWNILETTENNGVYPKIKNPWKSTVPPLMTGFVNGLQGTHCNNMGQLLIKFPWDTKPQGIINLAQGPWIPCHQLLSGSTYGSWFIPQPDQEVIIGFLNNNINYPIVMGCLYNQIQKPMDISNQSVALATDNHKIILDGPSKNFIVEATNDMVTTVGGSYKMAIQGEKSNSYNIIIDQGNINITASNGNYNLKINGDVNFDIKGNLNFNVEKNIEINCKKFQIKNTETLWEDTSHTLKNTQYNLKTQNADLEGMSNKSQWTNYNMTSENYELSTTMAKWDGKKMDIVGKVTTIESPMMTIKGDILQIKSTMATIKTTGILMIKSDMLVNIMAGVCNILTTITFVIRGPVGTVGAVPPLLP